MRRPRVDAGELENSRDRHRRVPIGRRVIAQLAPVILTPAVSRPITREAAGMGAAAGKLPERQSTSYQDRDLATRVRSSIGLAAAGRRWYPELPALSPAPAVGCTTRVEGAGVGPTREYRGECH